MFSRPGGESESPPPAMTQKTAPITPLHTVSMSHPAHGHVRDQFPTHPHKCLRVAHLFPSPITRSPPSSLAERARGEPATLQVQVSCAPPVLLLPTRSPFSEIAIVAGHANVDEPVRHGSDSSTDTVTSDGFVAVKPIPPPRSITEVVAPVQAGTPQITPIFETPPATPVKPGKPAAGLDDRPGVDHVALDIGDDIDPM